uniref:Uncharacterized protein n=1 Tax=Pseudictyota dubia TaxID=2749911 RepID=A0A7R9W904_9STRA|mmetsp:Transcript_38584/g.71333  ORF Transcript_38584/g.71333 Transcript_38584/m.71333 type:complete len:432 (+) Transcript_38584:106-1401(+)
MMDELNEKVAVPTSTQAFEIGSDMNDTQEPMFAPVENAIGDLHIEAGGSLIIPAESQGNDDVLSHRRWDLTFDTAEPLGIRVKWQSNEVCEVVTGSQAERLGIIADGSTFVLAVGGNPTYNDPDMKAELKRCKNGLSASVVVTFGTKREIPSPLWKPLWTFVVFLIQCVPVAQGPDLLTGRNGMFLGLLGPADRCFDCCCYFMCCGKTLLLSTAVCLLALGQLISAISLLGAYAADQDTDMSEQVVDIIVSLMVLKGVEMRQPQPIAHFAFVQLLLAIMETASACFGIISLKGGVVVGSIMEALYKAYYSWIAWSLAKEFRSGNDEERLEETDAQESGPEEPPTSRDIRGSTPSRVLRPSPGNTIRGSGGNASTGSIDFARGEGVTSPRSCPLLPLPRSPAHTAQLSQTPLGNRSSFGMSRVPTDENEGIV